MAMRWYYLYTYVLEEKVLQISCQLTHWLNIKDEI